MTDLREYVSKLKKSKEIKVIKKKVSTKFEICIGSKFKGK